MVPKPQNNSIIQLTRYKTLIVDVDGTLYPPSSMVSDLISTNAKRFMVDNVGIDPEQIASLINRFFETYGSILTGLTNEYKVDPEFFIQQVFSFNPAEFIHTDPSISRALDAFSGLRRLVFSNSPQEHIIKILKAIGILECFDLIIDRRMLKYLSKPNPHAFESMFAIIGEVGSDCIFVDDELRNLKAAKEFCMLTIWINHTKASVPDFVDFAVPELKDILGLLQV